MSQPVNHPSPGELRAYGLGQLSADQAIGIEEHISECHPCCETIADLSSDTFVELLQEVEHVVPCPAETKKAKEAKGPVVTQSAASEIPAPLKNHPRYEIVGLIGRGGMGHVYEARHRKMDRRVALKVLNLEFMRNKQAVDRFHREFKTAAQLTHPNIVTAHDADNAEDYHFMVMEYVDGVDLAQVVKDRNALPPVEAAEYIRQAAIGLQYAHEQGMVHRDIKPHNLMLTDDGTVKILDFGLATFAPGTLPATGPSVVGGALTTVGAIMGTPDFISPEQAEDATQVDIRSDIYSLGATLYQLLCGRPPFSEGGVTDKLDRHARAEPEPVETLQDGIPDELGQVVAKMMAKRPEDRFQTPAEVASALEYFLHNVDVTAEAALKTQAERKTQSDRQAQADRITQADRQAQADRMNQSDREGSSIGKWVAIASILLATIAAGIVFYLQTGNGTIRVELMDDSLEATIKGQTVEVVDGEKTFEIGAGRQQMVIRQKGSDTEFVTDAFRVWRNDEIKFEVKLVAGEVVVAKDGKFFDRNSGDWSSSKGDLSKSKVDSLGEGGAASMTKRRSDPYAGMVPGSGRLVAFNPEERVRVVQSPIKGVVSKIQKGMVEGARVQAGDWLMTIEPAKTDKVESAELELAELKGELERARAKVEFHQRLVDHRTMLQTAALAQADELIGAAKADYESKQKLVPGYEAKELQAKKNYQRQETMFKTGLQAVDQVEIAKKEWDIARAELGSAKASVDAARSNWYRKRRDRKLTELSAKAKVDEAKLQREEAKGRLASLQKKMGDLESKRDHLNRLNMLAPCDGVLFRVFASERGQAVQEGDKLFKIVPEVTEFAVELSISGEYMPRVQTGDRAELYFEGWPVPEHGLEERPSVGIGGAEATSRNSSSGLSDGRFSGRRSSGELGNLFGSGGGLGGAYDDDAGSGGDLGSSLGGTSDAGSGFGAEEGGTSFGGGLGGAHDDHAGSGFGGGDGADRDGEGYGSDSAGDSFGAGGDLGSSLGGTNDDGAGFGAEDGGASFGGGLGGAYDDDDGSGFGGGKGGTGFGSTEGDDQAAGGGEGSSDSSVSGTDDLGWGRGPGRFGGEVHSIDPVADEDGNFRVIIRATERDEWPSKRYLRPGIRVQGWIKPE